MKKHQHFLSFIFIFVFLGIALFIVREDIRSSLDNLISDFKSGEEATQKTSVLNEENKVQLKDADTPGALKVLDNISNTKTTTLSKSNIITISNKARKENGNLSPLTENKILDFSAEKKLEDMFSKQYFEHVSRDGIGVANLAQQSGYEYILIGENLALGNFENDKALVDAWMASSGHRANILNKNYTEIGVAVGKGQYNGQEVWMAVEHFGTPRSVCPAIDEILYGTILINQKTMNEMYQDLTTRKANIKNGSSYGGRSFYEQVNSYNELVESYNNLIISTKQKIEEYNKQVQIFNTCLYSYQQ